MLSAEAEVFAQAQEQGQAQPNFVIMFMDDVSVDSVCQYFHSDTEHISDWLCLALALICAYNAIDLA